MILALVLHKREDSTWACAKRKKFCPIKYKIRFSKYFSNFTSLNTTCILVAFNGEHNP